MSRRQRCLSPRAVLLLTLHCLYLIRRSAQGLGLIATSNHARRVVVVGKVIIDEYLAPDQNKEEAIISVGGGGPQAAFGAAAALALLSGSDSAYTITNSEEMTPPPQPVTFLGPVGGLDWTQREDDALKSTLQFAVESTHLISGKGLRTPRIQLWHDEDQQVQWIPLNDSFGEQGASELWKNRPCASDILQTLGSSNQDVICHVILEGGAQAAGKGQDGAFLQDAQLRERCSFVGVEPVVFPEASTGKIATEDLQSCCTRLDRISDCLDCISPDLPLYKEMDPSTWTDLHVDVGVRNGPKGSLLRTRSSGEGTQIPVASLKTVDGKPVNPTGAGNAYAAAFTTCLGCGASPLDAACIASAIGAVFCEYTHIPPWTYQVLTRIRQGAHEIRSKVSSSSSVSNTAFDLTHR